MDNDFNKIQNEWNTNKNSIQSSTENIDSIYQKIILRKRDNYFFYYGTIITLATTLIAISLFFYFVAPVEMLLSRVGVCLMFFGLFFRVIIEIISIVKSKRIDVTNNALGITHNSIIFYKFRKTIQKVIAPIIAILYTIGFYMITPEFSIYIDFWYLFLIDLSYIIIGIFLFFHIKKGIKKEMEILLEIICLREELTN